MEHPQALKWQIKSFRSPQQEVINHVSEGASALMIMPTGGGKSLCYQWVAAASSDRFVVVVSPLIALMADQQDKARELGIDAIYINSSLSKEEREKRVQKVRKGKCQLVFVTPERFRKQEFVEAVKQRAITLLAIDEAHCISQWGQDFRPEYSRLGEIRQELGYPPVLALTATATPEVQQDIIVQLQREGEDFPVFKAPIFRPNLNLKVHDPYGREEKIRSLVGLRHIVPGPGIIYFSLISELEKVSQELSKLGLDHMIYHGQMSPKLRNKNQRQFIKSESDWILATPAFGLGVDKPNVRLVVHCEIPASLEAYYQEIGRAGRDGLESEIHLLFDEDDISIQMDFIKWATPDESFVRMVYQTINKNRDRILSQGIEFIREQMHFYHKRDFRVETSLNLLERWGCVSINPQNSREINVVNDLPDDLLELMRAEERKKNLTQKLYHMVQWAHLSSGCRMQYIYDYFGEKESKPCGKCDLCLQEVL